MTASERHFQQRRIAVVEGQGRPHVAPGHGRQLDVLPDRRGEQSGALVPAKRLDDGMPIFQRIEEVLAQGDRLTQLGRQNLQTIPAGAQDRVVVGRLHLIAQAHDDTAALFEEPPQLLRFIPAEASHVAQEDAVVATEIFLQQRNLGLHGGAHARLLRRARLQRQHHVLAAPDLPSTHSTSVAGRTERLNQR